MSGTLELERARLCWFLSIRAEDLPFPAAPGARSTFRSLTIDNEAVDFSEGFTDLHTQVYAETLAGRGFGIEAARPSIELVHKIRHTPLSPVDQNAHAFLQGER
jgi:UDP-N-acetyl-2-amino-2-deoxyglucuronate dehydrogenase